MTEKLGNPSAKIPAAALLKGEIKRLLSERRQKVPNPRAVGDFTVESRAKLNSKGEDVLRDFLLDKGFDSQILLNLASSNVLGALIIDLVIRSDNKNYEAAFNQVVLDMALDEESEHYGYSGSSGENALIDLSIKNSDFKEGIRSFAGFGVSRVFRSERVFGSRLGTVISDTPVVVIGAGAAGIMATRALIETGFKKDRIFVIDKSGEYGGLWNQKNVYEASKNNPFELDFQGITVDAAPGPGITVQEFLKDLELNEFPNTGLPPPLKARVNRVVPGDLQHTVYYQTAEGADYLRAPIVINTLGVGKPLPPNRKGYMTTSVKGSEAGIRWQQVLTPEQAEKYRSKSLVFIGLGNSTAEMLMQISKLNAQGFNIDYKVLTHFPKEALDSPDNDVVVGGKTYRIFRNISLPNLVNLTGDLTDVKSAYYEALYRGRVLPGVKMWNIEPDGKSMTVVRDDSVPPKSVLNFDQLYTLIGYGHSKETLESMGMTVLDEYLGVISRDYDGEIHRNPGAKGRERLYRGYFGLGAILKSPESPNDQVIPGIMHRLYDLLFTTVIRALEYKDSEASYERFKSRA